MIANTLFAAGAFVSLVAAIPMAQAPHQKRDIVWETQTEIALTTVPVTVTHWLEPGETAPADAAVAAAGNNKHWGHKGNGHGHGGHGGHHGKPPKPETTQAAQQPPPPAYEQPPSQEAPHPAPTTQQAPPPAPTTQQAPPPPPATYQAPPPAPTTRAPPPAPTTQQAPPPAYTPPVAQPSPQPEQPSGGSGSGQMHSGDITHWTPALGACGWDNTESEPVVAVSTGMYDASMIDGNPNNAGICGKYVDIVGASGSVTKAKVVDRCGGCAENDLDLSPTLFKAVYPAGDGRVSNVKWSFAS